MRLFPRRRRGAQSEAPTPVYEVPVAFGSSLTFRCDCGRGMYPSAVVNGTETSKTIRMTCGGCKRILDVTLDAEYAIKAFTRTSTAPAAPGLVTARRSLAASLMRDETLAQEPDHVQTIAKGILLDLDDDGLQIVVKEDVGEAAPQIPALDAILAVMGIPVHEATDGLRRRARRDLGIPSLAEAENTPHPYQPNPLDPPRARFCLVCCGTAAHWTHASSEVESDADVLGRARPDRPTGW